MFTDDTELDGPIDFKPYVQEKKVKNERSPKFVDEFYNDYEYDDAELKR